jgi:UDP-N-acetylmuramoyl-tripeptide--D-alanyl-D-alanine ligase
MPKIFSPARNFLFFVLAALARGAMRRFRPLVVGVTGSVGKTSAREAIAAVLGKKYRVRKAEKNYNNEIGLPLSILGIPHGGRSPIRWVFNLLAAAFYIFFGSKESYPKVLVLEYGIDHPRDMDYLLSIARPTIAVVTAIGEIPVHVEFFKDAEELVREKAKLVEALPKDGWAVLNHDDSAVYEIKKLTDARIFTFGREKNADFRIMGGEVKMRINEEGEKIPEGIAFKVTHKGSTVPFRLAGSFGFSHISAASAAAAVGVILKMNLVEISQALEGCYIPPPGRLRLIPGIKNSFILDDTYNASPDSMRSALETLRALPGRRKIAVLGDMLEIGRFTEQAHRALGDCAAEFVDMLLTVGSRAKFIADQTLHRGISDSGRVMAREDVMEFSDAVSAGKALDPLIREGDLILVKGSQAMRLEKTVEEIMAEPQRATELLVRQEPYWKKTS